VSIVDALVAHPGLYVGVDRVQGTDLVGSARMVVTPLPGNAGVTLDYEIFNPARGAVRGHVEHTVIARAHGDGTVMIVADTHAGALVTLHETEPGVFEPGPGGSPYPMRVVVAMPEPGVLHHHWWYGAPGDQAVPRDLAELTRLD
jgi:hypothetical protein